MSLVGDAASAFTGGSDMALNEQRRQELLQSVLARFKGQGASPRLFNFGRQGGAFDQNAIAAQPPIVPTDTALPTTRDNSANVMQAQQALQAPIPGAPALPMQMEMPTAEPPTALPQPGLLQRMESALVEPMPLTEGGLPARELVQPDMPPPQQDDIAQWRSAWQDAARTHQASAYTDLRRMGFDDQEVFGILGGWRELPATVVEKLARMGQTSVPAYAQGTETADFMREKQLSQQNAQYGARGMDPSLGGKFGDPESYAQSMFQYNDDDGGFGGSASSSGGSGGGLRVNNDPVIMRLENMAKPYVSPLTGQIFDPEGFQKVQALIALRTAQQAGDNGATLEQMLGDADLKALRDAPKNAWVFGGASSQRFVGGVPGKAAIQSVPSRRSSGYSDTLAEYPTEVPARAAATQSDTTAPPPAEATQSDTTAPPPAEAAPEAEKKKTERPRIPRRISPKGITDLRLREAYAALPDDWRSRVDDQAKKYPGGDWQQDPLLKEQIAAARKMLSNQGRQ